MANSAFSRNLVGNAPSEVFDETPTGAINGTNKAYDTASNYVSGTLRVYRNGIRQELGSGNDFTETDANTFTMESAPETGDKLVVDYKIKSGSSAGDADTVDGRHASQLLHMGNVYAFHAKKTAGDQTTVTNNNTTVVTFETKEEYGDTSQFDTVNDRWTAPADGWLSMHITLSVAGGDGTDDSMYWGAYANGSVKFETMDNWRAETGSGIEKARTHSGGFKVSSGDTVDVRYRDTSFAVSLVDEYCHVSGLFIPD